MKRQATDLKRGFVLKDWIDGLLIAAGLGAMGGILAYTFAGFWGIV